MKIAVVGCSHGELDSIYEDIERIEREDNIVVDLVVICGDFQAVRNEHDLHCMAVPVKYRQLQTFHKYYSGESSAPKLTVFVGGNHEASNYLQTLSFGGWVAKNIFYMGYASVVRYKGVRIGGISGIHNRNDTNLGHFERLPFDESTKRSAFHMRRTDVYKLMQLGVDAEEHTTDGSAHPPQALDVMISHDWPINIHSCGDVRSLLRRKKYFRSEVENNCLGNPLLEPLVRHLKPRYWFAAHLHVRFEALVNHTEDKQIQTRFLALDKVLPNRQYMEVMDIEPTVPSDSDQLEYDAEWLAVLKSTNSLLSIEKKCSVPQMWSRLHSVDETAINQVKELFNNDLKIAEDFRMCEPALFGRDNDRDPQRVCNFTNPQTVEFCKRLGITDPMSAIIDSLKSIPNPDQISISDDEEEDAPQTSESPQKRLKDNDDIDGGNLFFIDRKGVDEPKGDQNCKPIVKETETHNTSHDVMIASTSTPTSGTTKRKRTRMKRSDQKGNFGSNSDKKATTKQKRRKALELRRKLIIERFEWIKANLPMKSMDSHIEVLS